MSDSGALQGITVAQVIKTKSEPAPIECRACGLQVMARGGDLEGWKAVQLSPEVAELAWFCMKPPCQQGYRAALSKAQVTWAGGELEEPELPAKPRARPRPADVESPEPVTPEPPRYPEPGELMAYETTDSAQMGYRDEPAPEDAIPFSRFDEPPDGPPAPDAQPSTRYVPKSSEPKDEKFVRRRGKGKAK